jgi:IS30 family transposase
MSSQHLSLAEKYYIEMSRKKEVTMKQFTRLSLLIKQPVVNQLYKHLRHQGKTYRKRYGSTHNRTGIPNRVDIDQRPAAANNRERIGDWEADTIIEKPSRSCGYKQTQQ